MKKLLAALATLALVPAAHAAEKGADFTHSAEFRVRHLMAQNPTANKDDISTANATIQRFKLGTTFRANEKFSATLTLLHNATWGSNDLGLMDSNGYAAGTGDSSRGVLDGTRDGDNLLLVQEAYGTWNVNDEFNLRFGRGSFTMADGLVISANDWENTPFAFEGILAHYEMEFGRFGAWAAKFAEYSRGMSAATPTSPANPPTAGSGTDVSDPEANAYGLSFDLKTMPAWLKMVNVHVIKSQKATTPSAGDGTGTQAIAFGQDITRYGVSVGGDMMNIDYHVAYAAQSGNYLRTPPTAKLKTDGHMMHGVVGYKMPDFMNSRISFTYHMDTGKKNTATAEPDKSEAYDPYFYDRHANSGLMDIVDWGNLTYMSVGYTLTPMDQTDIGLQYHVFTRTEKKSGNTAGDNAKGLTGITSAATDDTKDDLGSEIDLVATRKYDSGFSIQARYGMFMPGKAFKLNNADKDATISQLFVEAKMNF